MIETSVLRTSAQQDGDWIARGLFSRFTDFSLAVRGPRDRRGAVAELPYRPDRLAGSHALFHVAVMTTVAGLNERGVIEVAGADRASFLQGLVSNDVAAVTAGRAVWTALLTPQGKWVADFFVYAHADTLLLDCEKGQVGMLLQRLHRYRLRADVVLRDRSDAMAVYAVWDGVPERLPPGAVAAPDPRLPEAGWRVLSAEPLAVDAADADWDAHRLALGLPDGSRDLEPEKTVLLEAGFDELGGVSWTKGCFMGQELTARTKYRGLVKRRLVPVVVAGILPRSGTPLLRDGVEVGTLRSGRDDRALGLLRIDAIGASLTCGEARVVARVPDWMRIAGPAA